SRRPARRRRRPRCERGARRRRQARGFGVVRSKEQRSHDAPRRAGHHQGAPGEGRARRGCARIPRRPDLPAELRIAPMGASRTGTARTFGAVLKDIGGNVDRLVRAELRYAIAQLRAEIGAAASASRIVAAGAVLAMFAAAFVLLAVMFALSRVMPGWLASLVVAAVGSRSRRADRHRPGAV